MGEHHRYGNIDFQRPPVPLGKQRQQLDISCETQNGIRNREDGGVVKIELCYICQSEQWMMPNDLTLLLLPFQISWLII